MRGIVCGTGRGRQWEHATHPGKWFTGSARVLCANPAKSHVQPWEGGGYRSCPLSCHVAIGPDPGCGGTAGRFEADGVLPDSGREVENRPYARRIAAGAGGVDRGGAAQRESGGGSSDSLTAFPSVASPPPAS